MGFFFLIEEYSMKNLLKYGKNSQAFLLKYQIVSHGLLENSRPLILNYFFVINTEKKIFEFYFILFYFLRMVEF